MLDMAHQFFNRRPPAQIDENVGDRMTMKLRRGGFSRIEIPSWATFRNRIVAGTIYTPSDNDRMLLRRQSPENEALAARELSTYPMRASCSLAALSEKIKVTSSTMRVLP
jgi:hypothetical protein